MINYGITYDTVMKSSGVGGGGAGGTSASFDLLKIWAGNIPENPGENSAQRCLTSKIAA